MRSKQHSEEELDTSDITDEQYHAVVDDWLCSNQVFAELHGDQISVWKIFGTVNYEALFSLKEMVRELIHDSADRGGHADQSNGALELFATAQVFRDCAALLMKAANTRALKAASDYVGRDDKKLNYLTF